MRKGIGTADSQYPVSNLQARRVTKAGKGKCASAVGTEFDDTFIVAVRGPSGTLSEVIATVNQVGTVDQIPVALPVTYTDADFELDDAGRTGWQTKSIDISALGGGPIYVSFTVSDIGDEIYSTIIFVDISGCSSVEKWSGHNF